MGGGASRDVAWAVGRERPFAVGGENRRGGSFGSEIATRTAAEVGSASFASARSRWRRALQPYCLPCEIARGAWVGGAKARGAGFGGAGRTGTLSRTMLGAGISCFSRITGGGCQTNCLAGLASRCVERMVCADRGKGRGIDFLAGPLIFREISGILARGYQTIVNFLSRLARVSGMGPGATRGPNTTQATKRPWITAEAAKGEIRRSR